ncbi:hypothetical protein Tfer_0963 [Thermincola ferriacetica]|uniref:Lipoprotein n=1 Tax=Thermincola ferriacetica TaxID=281456 RepID=A0A0L6W5N2_9FIRM|nr:hypothetical protein [Thermincola ferriacetica]KNZ70399.1 hypothetical protein Tfer_0963 [Thermincola ferriacetica]
MNRYLIKFLLGFLLLGTIMGCQSYKYPAGRDTERLFGDGKYQILKVTDDVFSLNNVETAEPIESHVYKYKEINQFIYVIGRDNGYTVLNYETGQIKKSKELKNFNQSEREKFSKMQDN